MTGSTTDDARHTLEVLAQLASRTRTTAVNPYDVIGRSSDWSWEGLAHRACFVPHDVQDHLKAAESGQIAPPIPAEWRQSGTVWWPRLRRDRMVNPEQGGRLAGLDQLRHRDTILRAGWLWLAGTVKVDGDERTVCMPLLKTRIQLTPAGFAMGGGWSVADAGDVYPNPLIQPDSEADWVVSNPQFGDIADATGTHPVVPRALKDWAMRAATACGLVIERWEAPRIDPRSIRRRGGLAAVPGVGVYIDPVHRMLPRSKLLMEWTTDADIGSTAFARLYRAHAEEPSLPLQGKESSESDHETHGGFSRTPYRQTRPMLPAQLEVVRLARSEPVITVTGPPGTGKTHVMCEVALDAVARHESVLIGANSEYAVEVLARQLGVAGGPIPVQFGGSVTGADLSDRLVDLTTSSTPGLRRRAELEMNTSLADHDQRRDDFHKHLRMERRVRRLLRDPSYLLDLEGRMRRLPGGEAGLDGMLLELSRLDRSTGLRRWWRRRMLERRVMVPADELQLELDDLDTHRRARELMAGEGLCLELMAQQLVEAESEVFSANARWLGHLTVERLAENALGRRTVQQVSTASRASRTRRREMLKQVNGGALADAAPLWLGTVDDIDDVLPARAAMFDLLILDEASQIDQISAAGALLRASRAVVCGDPRQLRHVSFLSDDAVDEANAVGDEVERRRPRIDVRRDSIFDYSIGEGTAVRLDTHFRSDPHLIEFSARRFYDNRLSLATRSPVTDRSDHIDVFSVPGRRDDDKVNRAEIEAILHQLRILSGVQFRSVGVLSPFRSQVNALTEAILADWDPEGLVRRRVEVGTVHSFQGAEFDAVLASWSLDEASPRHAWLYLNDPNVFNVMVTRARKKMVVFTSHPSPPGLAGDYVKYAALTAEPHIEAPSDDPGRRWPGMVADALRDAGYVVELDYEVGPFSVDVVVRDVGPRPVAIICRPDRNGDDWHVERESVLRRLGWHVLDAFESRWHDDVGKYAVEFANRLSGLPR